MKKFSNKLEATIFGNGAGDADTPAGILNGLTQIGRASCRERV